MLVISDSYLQYRTFALSGRNPPSSRTQGAAPKVACRWAMNFIPFREYTRDNEKAHVNYGRTSRASLQVK